MKKNVLMLVLMLTCLLLTAAAWAEEPAADADIPAAQPNIPAASEERLAEALNASGGSLAFTNPADAYIWPMIPAEEEGVLCVMSTNGGVDGSISAVYATVEARAGDALVLTFRTSTEAAFDLLQMSVNGETVKVFGGEKEWTNFAYAFPADGVYEIMLAYVKDEMDGAGSDVVYIDEVKLLTGEDAAAAVQANPAYPQADMTALKIMNADAQQIIFDDPTFALLGLFGLADYYIVPGGEAQVLAALDASVDPETAYIANYYGGGSTGSVVDCMTEAGYAFTTPLDTVETTGFAYTNISLYPQADCALVDVRTAVCFASEAAVTAFLQQMRSQGYQVNGWSYADGTPQQSGAAEYTLTFIDQQGEFLSGVKVSIIAGDYCEIGTSGDDGMITFTAEPRAYEVHVLDAPEGYAFDPDESWTLDAAGGDTIIDLERRIAGDE